MPNRLIKESICTSDNLNELSWFEECVFYRLIVNCDDYGRYDARPAILRSRLFPLKSVTDKQVGEALKKLSTVGIVKLYESSGKAYLQFVTWNCHQRIRNKKSKYPDPIDGKEITDINMSAVSNNLPQVAADCGELSQVAAECARNPIQSESNPNPLPPYPPKGARTVEPLECLNEPLKSKVEEWLEYKRQRKQAYKPAGLKAFVKRVKQYAESSGDNAVMDAIDDSMTNNWAGVVWDRIGNGRQDADSAKPKFQQSELKEGELPW